MTSHVLPIAALAAAVLAAAGCSEKPTGGTPSATAVTTAPPAATTAPPAASATASAAPAPSDSAEESAPAKKYACGAKGQTPCPMQGWMKKVMADASASGDGARLADALTQAGKKPPAGYTEWTAIAQEGAAKAKKGDIDGAKASCKKCHDLYKDKYKATMRDQPW
jgi:hypothetical protein